MAENKKEELLKRFGSKLEEVEGLLDFLASQSHYIEDVKVMPKKQSAAYVLDKHWWSSGSGGIGMASIVGVYRDGQTDSRSYTYRDQYNPRKDDWSLYYKKVKIVKVTSEIISILAINRDGNKDDMTFYLEAKSKPETKRPRISQKEKETFESHVKSEMKRISDAYQHNHPLFTRQTQINEHIIAHELKIAAFVLFEQIDTDRCTLEGSGWLGDQYRNSIWVIKNKEQAIQLCEDHAYTKQRGCDIRGLRIFEGKIFATNWEGKDLILKILNKTKNK